MQKKSSYNALKTNEKSCNAYALNQHKIPFKIKNKCVLASKQC